MCVASRSSTSCRSGKGFAPSAFEARLRCAGDPGAGRRRRPRRVAPPVAARRADAAVGGDHPDRIGRGRRGPWHSSVGHRSRLSPGTLAHGTVRDGAGTHIARQRSLAVGAGRGCTGTEPPRSRARRVPRWAGRSKPATCAKCTVQQADLHDGHPVSRSTIPDEHAVVDYLTQNRDGFVNVAQTPDSRSLPYELDVTSQSFSSGSPSNGTQSVVLKMFQNVGGAHPSTWYKAFTYDLGQHHAGHVRHACSPRGLSRCWRSSRSCRRDLERQTGLTGAVSDRRRTGPVALPELRDHRRCVDLLLRPGRMLPSEAGALSVSVPRNAHSAAADSEVG